MKDWLVFIALSYMGILFPKYCISQSIVPSSTVYNVGKPITINFNGGTGSPTDWIGIYKSGQVPGNVASTVWQYVNAKSGEITFSEVLSAGKYDLHLLCCDGYNVIASYKNLEIVPLKFESRLTYYKDTDTVLFKIYDAKPQNIVRIYKQSDFTGEILNPNTIALAIKSVNTINVNNIAEIKFHLQAQNEPLVALLIEDNAEIERVKFEVHPNPTLPNVIEKIAVGSCANQHNKQKAYRSMYAQNPDCYLYVGDNLYIDTYDSTVMKNAYEFFITQREEYQKLRATTPILATWDDHDYGCCDEDKDYPLKFFSQKTFLNFFDEPLNSIRRNQEGIYTSYTIGDDGKKLQIILLDTRFFEDDKKPNNGCGKNDYCPWTNLGDTSKTILGKQQWFWLKEKLLEKADLRIIASSVQFAPEYNGWEGWSIFPYERKKMQKLIADTKAEHVFFVSGDIHYNEISKLPSDGNTYPLYDLTASAINQSWNPELNKNRVNNYAFGNPNFGIIDIDWEGKNITLRCIDENNDEKYAHIVPFSEMEFKTNEIKTLKNEENWMTSEFDSVDNTYTILLDRLVEGVIHVQDVSGRMIKSISVNYNNNIKLDNLPSGSYLVIFESRSHSEVLKLIIP